MIPHQSALRDIPENGVSCRVEACRRRLRANRINEKIRVQTDPEPRPELAVNAAFVETGSPESEEAGIT